MLLTYLGDAIWVIGLTIMFQASTRASNLTAGESQLTLLGARLPRTVALWTLPGSAFAFSLWLAFAARTLDLDADGTLLLFGMRMLAASLLPLLHLRLLRGMVKPLGRKEP